MTRPPRRTGGGPRRPVRPSAPRRPRRAADAPVVETANALPPETKAARLVEKKAPVPATETAAAALAGPAAAARSATIGPRVSTTGGGLGPDRITVGGIRVDPPPPPILPGTDPGPLLLLPLRLEYRLVTKGGRTVVADLNTDLTALKAIDDRPVPRAVSGQRARLKERRAAVSAILKKDVPTARLVLAGTRELWFRWYPDESFARKGIEPPTPAETAALAAFVARVGAKPWFDATDTEVAAAWQDFATIVGPYRAVHLMRTRSTPPTGRYEEDIGRITALPSNITLFAVAGSAVSAIGTGGAIPPNDAGGQGKVSYTPDAIQPGGWLRDFALAEQLGMALRITDAAAIDKALAADHIVAIGTFGGDAKAELGDLVKDGIANGSFWFLRQDTPTNNGPGVRAGIVDALGDPAGFLKIATQNEAGQFTEGKETGADLLADALAIDRALLRPAIYAADAAFAEAKAMLRVIGPAILDGALDGATVVDGVDENNFIDELARAGVARGALSPMRFGNNPFGMLPMTDVAELETEDASRLAASVQGFLKSYAAFARGFLPGYAEGVVPVFTPEDSGAAGKLEAILKSNRVSRRVDVADVGASGTAPIGCPYVAGTTPPTKPETYLHDLITKSLSQLPDPTDADTATPLLYRLARLTLTRNVAGPIIQDTRPATGPGVKGVFEALEGSGPLKSKVQATGVFSRPAGDIAKGIGLKNVNRAILKVLGRLNTEFVAAIKILEAVAARPQGVAELETLLLETVDLLQHRVDALAVGLAHARLTKQRRASDDRLLAGYFGCLGKLRPQSVTGGSDGYIQAPSMAQATTAAVLRSAFLRHRADGAFEIDLGSRRVRRALTLLDVLKKGLTLEEALGLRGERWLHDNKLSRLTLDIRGVFPFVNSVPPEGDGGATTATPGPAGVRVFDGLKFIKGSLTPFKAPDRPSLQTLQAVLSDDLDALSDLVLAEAVHRRAMGQGEAAKAWINVLSGSTVPGDPIVTRTQRHGQGSSYRATLLATPAVSAADATPREIAEPTFAAMAGALLPNFATLSAVVSLTRVDDPSRRHRLTVNLRTVLGLRPIDLVIGGRSEAEVRLRSHAIAAWLTDPAVSAAIGLPAAEAFTEFVNRTVAVTFADAASGGSLEAALGRAEKLRAMGSQSRVLEPADLNAAASPANALDEAHEIALIVTTIGILRARVTRLNARLSADASALRDAQSLFLQDAREVRRRLDLDKRDQSVPALLAGAELHRRDLYAALKRVSAYAEPAALRLFTVEEATANPDALAETLDGLAARLAARSARLGSALAATAAGGFQRLEEARIARRTLVEALQGALDGDALPILPPIARRPETTPLLLPAASPSQVLGVWAAVRSRVARAVEIAGLLPGTRANPVAPGATADDFDIADQDQRPETEAPRSQHFGTFLATDAAMAGSSFAGFACDEWAEQRPSRTQLAAMAVNYDSPQSEPPQCLLLCVPPKPDFGPWTDLAAARMVFEAIQWMKIRALSTDDKPWPASLLPRANQVAFNGTARRIPQRRFRFVDLGFTGFENQVLVADSFPASEMVGQDKGVVGETTGFNIVKE